MRIETPSGAGTLCPDTATVKPKIAEKSFRQSKQPKAAPPHQVTLGSVAESVLQTLCQRHGVKPESMLRAIAESMLSDACEDPQLGPCIARDARHIEETGHVPDHRHPIPPPPAFPRNLRQGKEAA